MLLLLLLLGWRREALTATTTTTCHTAVHTHGTAANIQIYGSSKSAVFGW
jgi:hypothetical protein